MTDYTKLVEALRWCDASFLHECDNCLYVKYKHCKDDCMDRMLRDAAAAIEELQAKVDRLTKENMELATDRPEMEELNGHWEWKNPNYEQHEPKRGKWIVHTEVKNIYGGICVECPVCGDHFVVLNVSDEKYCRSCGAKMEVQDADT